MAASTTESRRWPWQPATESYSSQQGGEEELALQASLIEEERRRWAGTHRQELTSDELDERYFVREVIGSGAYGTVYRAIRRADMEEFAIKELDMSASPRQRADAIKECVLWQEISRVYHPSILPLVEILEVASEQALFLVTERIAHGVLSDAVFDIDMSEQACRQIMIQLTAPAASRTSTSRCELSRRARLPSRVELAPSSLPRCPAPFTPVADRCWPLLTVAAAAARLALSSLQTCSPFHYLIALLIAP